MFNSQRDEHYRDSRFLREEYYAELRAEHQDDYDDEPEPLTPEEEALREQERIAFLEDYHKKTSVVAHVTEDQLRRLLKINHYLYRRDFPRSESWMLSEGTYAIVPMRSKFGDNEQDFTNEMYRAIDLLARNYADGNIQRVLNDLAEVARVCEKYNWPPLKPEDYGKGDGFSS